jgi:hypothetical protein
VLTVIGVVLFILKKSVPPELKPKQPRHNYIVKTIFAQDCEDKYKDVLYLYANPDSIRIQFKGSLYAINISADWTQEHRDDFLQKTDWNNRESMKTEVELFFTNHPALVTPLAE